MPHGRSHPDTDTRGDTIEFAAVEPEQPERVTYEIHDGSGVSFHGDFVTPVEIRVGQMDESSPLFLHEGLDFPALLKAAGKEGARAWVLIQPDVFEKNSDLGWLVVTDYVEIGRATHPQFRFGRDISRRGHLALSPRSVPPKSDHNTFDVIGASPNPTKVIVDGRQHPFWNYELYC